MNWWRRRKIRKALEAHAKWKARREQLERLVIIHRGQMWYADNCVVAAGKEALYGERAEILMREK